MFVCYESDIYQCDITIHFSTGSSQGLMDYYFIKRYNECDYLSIEIALNMMY